MLFLSYSHEDYELANRLASVLEDKGYQVWMDLKRIPVGTQWSQEIEKGMNESTGIIVIISPNAVKLDSFVRIELTRASILGKPIYPLIVEEVPVESLPLEVVTRQHIPCIGNIDHGINELLNILQPPEHGKCIVELAPELSPLIKVESLEYALMSRFPATRRIFVKKEITAGHSGSKVYFVDAAFRNKMLPQAPHFLKINNAYSDEPRQLFERAYKTKLQAYMPFLSDATPHDKKNNRIGLLYRLGNVLGGFDSLDDLLHRDLREASKVIEKVCDALFEWNDGGENLKNLNVLELLKCGLSHSQHPERLNSRLSELSTRSQTILNLKTQSQFLDFETRWGLPNPIYFLANDNLWREITNKYISYPSGNIHGDLHVRNILALYTTEKKKSVDVSFIDFDTYDPDNLIFLDFAFLEISIIGQLFRLNEASNSIETYHELEGFSEYLATNLVIDDMPNLKVLSVGTWVLLRKIRDTVAKIAQVHPECRTAFWIARMAAGLQLVRKKRPYYPERLFSLLVAADSLNHIISEGRIQLPRGKSTSLKWYQK